MSRLSTKFILLFAIGGAILSAFLWKYHIENKIPPCTISGCSDVLTGKYSELFGIPVGTWGFFYYASLIGITIERLLIKHRYLDWMFFGILVSGWVFTLYLRFLEFFVIRAWCEWCWVSVVLLFGITVTFYLERKRAIRSSR